MMIDHRALKPSIVAGFEAVKQKPLFDCVKRAYRQSEQYFKPNSTSKGDIFEYIL